MSRMDEIQAIIDRYKAQELDKEVAIDEIVALHSPGGLTREGARSYLDGTAGY